MATWLFRGIPVPALVLGLAGLIPFGALALLVMFGRDLGLDGLAIRVARHALMTYAAVILSFMSGVNWGLAIAVPSGSRLWRRLTLSVLPALVAWVFLVVPFESYQSLLGLAFALALLLTHDLWAVARSEAPDWYGRLRLLLTSIAALALVAAAIA
jgi:hypothetical protein